MNFLGEHISSLKLVFQIQPQSYILFPLIFVNKVLLEYSHAYLLCINYGCFCALMAQLTSGDTYPMASKGYNIYCLSFCRKCWQTPTQNITTQWWSID